MVAPPASRTKQNSIRLPVPLRMSHFLTHFHPKKKTDPIDKEPSHYFASENNFSTKLYDSVSTTTTKHEREETKNAKLYY